MFPLTHWRANTTNANDGNNLSIRRSKCIWLARFQAPNAVIGIYREDRVSTLCLAGIEPCVILMITANEDEIAACTRKDSSNLRIVVQEMLAEAQLCGIGLRMTLCRLIERGHLRIHTEITRLQDEIDALPHFPFPASA